MYVIRTLLTCYNIGRVHGPRILYVILSIYVIRMYVITSIQCTTVFHLQVKNYWGLMMTNDPSKR